MNYIKKLKIVLLCVILTVGLLAVPAYAENSVDESNCDVGLAMTAVRDASNPDYVDIAIHINKNAGIHSLQFEVNYDSDVYELVDNNKLDASGYFFSQDLSVYPYSCNWFSPNATLYTGCDEFVTLRFKVKESAPVGNYEFTLANIKAKQFIDSTETKMSVFAGGATDSIEGANISGNIFSWDQTDNIMTYIYGEDSSDKDIADDIMLNKGQNAYYQASTEASVASTDNNCKYTYQSAINLSVDSSLEPRTYKLAVYKPGYALVIRSISVSNSGTTLEEGIFLSKYGDVSNNGKANITDVAWLTHYLANWEEYKNIDLKAADVDGNGEVNLRDIAILERHLAHWQGYEELPYVE